jgi:hypothetical protein
MEDRRGKLADDRPFGYRLTKDGKALVYWRGKEIMIVTGERAAKIRGEAEGGDEQSMQLLLAKMTGNFKHGNER